MYSLQPARRVSGPDGRDSSTTSQPEPSATETKDRSTREPTTGSLPMNLDRQGNFLRGRCLRVTAAANRVDSEQTKTSPQQARNSPARVSAVKQNFKSSSLVSLYRFMNSAELETGQVFTETGTFPREKPLQQNNQTRSFSSRPLLEARGRRRHVGQPENGYT